MSASAIVDWGHIDPTDWEPEPPPVRIDDLFIAEACVEAAKKILDDRISKMRSARDLLHRAADAVRAAQHETDLAIRLVHDALYDWAEARGAANAAQ